MSYDQRVNNLVEQFSNCKNSEDRYLKIISFGSHIKHFNSENKTPENKVQGCQSETYLSSTLNNDKVYFEAFSDALISKGLVGILVYLFNGEDPQKIIKEKFTFLEALKINESLSPNRSNGLCQMIMHLKRSTWKLIAPKT